VSGFRRELDEAVAGLDGDNDPVETIAAGCAVDPAAGARGGGRGRALGLGLTLEGRKVLLGTRAAARL
jgi:hypothetical protein